MITMKKITLFTRPDCHLCEEASDLVRIVSPDLVIEHVDIEGSINLLDRYGIRIPVLKREDGQELGWPFGEDDLRAFLSP